MFIDFLLSVFEQNRNDEAVVWKSTAYSYEWLLKAVQVWRETIQSKYIPFGAVVALETDFSPNAVAMYLALLESGCILVPLTNSVASKKEEFLEIAQVEVRVSLDRNDSATIAFTSRIAHHELYEELRRRGHPGLVLFSSGSTGHSKAAVHDHTNLLEKFKVSRHKLRAVTFLLYDHIGGVNTMLYALSNGGCIVTVPDRTPDGVLEAVERFQVDLLPTSPTFINLILLSEAYKRHTLPSLRTVTYGTEPMPESTLKRFHEIYPHIQLLQTYGLSELGILRSKSRSSDSLWVRIGGEGFQTRVVEGILHIKAASAMLGYLNAPSPFTEDGWFNTADVVEVDGEYLKILGRKSELINVGGEKVYPAEVESVIQELAEIGEVTVFGEKNPITGQMVCANVTFRERPIDPKAAVDAIKRHCRVRLQPYKVPVKIFIVDEQLHGERFKKTRILNDRRFS